jgi:hypothetical protein
MKSAMSILYLDYLNESEDMFVRRNMKALQQDMTWHVGIVPYYVFLMLQND